MAPYCSGGCEGCLMFNRTIAHLSQFWLPYMMWFLAPFSQFDPDFAKGFLDSFDVTLRTHIQ